MVVTDWSSAALATVMAKKKLYYFSWLKAVECMQKSQEAAARKMGVTGFQIGL